MITFDAFKTKYRIDDDMILASGFTWDELVSMHDDFAAKTQTYEDALRAFQKEHLEHLQMTYGDDRPVIHSMRWRVKDPEHLIAKAVRKKGDNFKKYRDMDTANYEKFFTDLAGIRCLLLFKSDWKKLHDYLVSAIEDDENRYLNDRCLEAFIDDSDIAYHAEPPKVHIRNGDAEELYLSALDPAQVKKGKVYRSAHYIIKYHGIYLELQVRTLYEESWGEIDHAIVYPYHTEDKVLKEYTELLNRLSGLADEMAMFFMRVEELESERGACVSHGDPSSCGTVDGESPDAGEEAGDEIITEQGGAVAEKGCDSAQEMLKTIVKYD